MLAKGLHRKDVKSLLLMKDQVPIKIETVKAIIFR